MAEQKKLFTTLHNRNVFTHFILNKGVHRSLRLVGGFAYVRHEHKVRTGKAIHSELLRLVLNQKLLT